MPKICIIGSGFSGLSAACYLSSFGHDVHVFEKNSEPGGRARQLKTKDGFVFDMGPSWYWMPDVFDKFFNDFGHRTSDFYQLKLLEPAFDIVFGKNDVMHVPANFEDMCLLFESIEKGSGAKLKKMMHEAAIKYEIGMNDLVYKPCLSIKEFANAGFLKGLINMSVFSSFSNHVRKYFSSPKLIALMEFPVLFLGAMPQDTPALYSLMNYACLKLGTWYPQGGFGKIINAFVSIAKNNGAHFHFNSTVEKIISDERSITGICSNGQHLSFDGLIASADYHHAENKLLGHNNKNYNESYWDKKVFAPSCLIYYLGVDKKMNRLNHHTLFFDEDLNAHAKEIYKDPKWPTKPLFYACCPSRTDTLVAPDQCENIFLLMPIATGIADNEDMREKYFLIMMNRLEEHAGEKISPHIIYKKSYCIKDFILDYNAYKGNAYGLANTLRQTALLKPKIKNRKLANMFYCGQLTVPGPGVPPSVISGKIAAALLNNQLKQKKHEVAV